MKSLIIIGLFWMFLISSCNGPTDGINKNKTKLGDFTILVIDSCEYIKFEDEIALNRVYSLTHKGNCKYCNKRNLKK